MDNQALKTYIEKLINPNSEAASMERMKTPLLKRLLPV